PSCSERRTPGRRRGSRSRAMTCTCWNTSTSRRNGVNNGYRGSGSCRVAARRRSSQSSGGSGPRDHRLRRAHRPRNAINPPPLSFGDADYHNRPDYGFPYPQIYGGGLLVHEHHETPATCGLTHLSSDSIAINSLFLRLVINIPGEPIVKVSTNVHIAWT